MAHKRLHKVGQGISELNEPLQNTLLRSFQTEFQEYARRYGYDPKFKEMFKKYLQRHIPETEAGIAKDHSRRRYSRTHGLPRGKISDISIYRPREKHLRQHRKRPKKMFVYIPGVGRKTYRRVALDLWRHKDGNVEVLPPKPKEEIKDEVVTSLASKMDTLKKEMLEGGLISKHLEMKRKLTIDYLCKKASMMKKKKTVKRMIKLPSALDILFHTKFSKTSTVHYFTQGHMIEEKQIEKNTSGLTNPINPFKVSDFTLGRGCEISSLKIKDRKTPGYLSNTYNTLQYCDILNRIYVPDKEKIIKSKLDLTPDFWKIVEGRPVLQKLDKDKLKYFLEDNLRKKLTKGLLGEDEAICEVQHRIDCTQFPPIEKELLHMESFKAFLHEKYCDCLDTLSHAEEISYIRRQVLNFQKELEDKLEIVIGDIQDIFDLRDRIKWCRDITYKMSPKVWKYEYSEEVKTFQSPFIKKICELNEIYLNCNTGIDYLNKTIIKMIEQLVVDVIEFGPPLIYFTKPIQFQNLIKDAEMDNMQYTAEVVNLAPKINKLQFMVHRVHVHFNGYLTRLNKIKNSLRKLYLKFKKKSDYYSNKLKEFTDEESYKKMVDSKHENVVIITLLVEEVYNMIVEHPTGASTLLGYMVEIEETFIDQLMILEEYYYEPAPIMEEAVDIVLNRINIRFAGAKQARVERNKAFILLKSMRNSIKPPVLTGYFRKLKYRSMEGIEEQEEFEEIHEEMIKTEKENEKLSFKDIHTIHFSKNFFKKINKQKYNFPYELVNLPKTPHDRLQDDSILNLVDIEEKESIETDSALERIDVASKSSSILSPELSVYKDAKLVEKNVHKFRSDLLFMKTWDADVVRNFQELDDQKEEITEEEKEEDDN